MKFYETSDVNFYVDVPHKWESYCQYPQRKTWGIKPLDRVRAINYYRDYVGSKMDPDMKCKAYYLTELNWHKSRIAPWACLPYYYATGNRFIKLEKAGPVGFKCSEFPMNIREVKEKTKQMQLEAERLAKKQWFEKCLTDECKRNAKKKNVRAEIPKKK